MHRALLNSRLFSRAFLVASNVADVFPNGRYWTENATCKYGIWVLDAAKNASTRRRHLMQLSNRVHAVGFFSQKGPRSHVSPSSDGMFYSLNDPMTVLWRQTRGSILLWQHRGEGRMPRSTAPWISGFTISYVCAAERFRVADYWQSQQPSCLAIPRSNHPLYCVSLWILFAGFWQIVVSLRSINLAKPTKPAGLAILRWPPFLFEVQQEGCTERASGDACRPRCRRP